MRDLEVYRQLCTVDMWNHKMNPRYPYTIKQDAVFTQHQIVLHYKQNYCQNIVVLKEPKDNKQPKEQMDGGAKETYQGPIYQFYSYNDQESE